MSRRGRSPRLRDVRLFAAALLVWWAGYPLSLLAQSDVAVSEQQVKAAYLYKFIGYVDWPTNAFPAPDSPFAIGVLGTRALRNDLAEVTSGRRVGNRPISVRQLAPNDSLDELQMLFIAADESDELQRLASTAGKQPLLIVTDSANALERGSVINFRTSDQRVRFEVALDSAASRELKLNSMLLAVAARVVSGEP